MLGKCSKERVAGALGGCGKWLGMKEGEVAREEDDPRPWGDDPQFSLQKTFHALTGKEKEPLNLFLCPYFPKS